MTEGPAEPGGLDAPQGFIDATSYQVRDELQDLIERDLLGPWDGELEVLPPRSQGPGERYLVGRLGPKQDVKPAAENAAATDADVTAGGDGADPELPELLTMQNAGRMWASSMGLSCVVDKDVDILTVTVAWGQYAKSEVLDDAGNPHRQWHREPIRRQLHTPLYKAPTTRYPLTSPQVYLRVDVRPRKDGTRVVELALVNEQAEPPANADTAWLFQPKIEVTAAARDGYPAFCPIGDPFSGNGDAPHLVDDAEEAHLQLLYRNQLRHSVGRNVAVQAHLGPRERCAYKLETTWLPTYEVRATIAPPADPGTALEGLELSMEALAEATPQALGGKLSPLANGYERWLDDQAAQVPGCLATFPVSTAGRICDVNDVCRG